MSLTKPEFRNLGVGKKLLLCLLDYCHGRFNQVFLWTLSTLEPARHVYKKFRFKLTETKTHDIWGHNLTEERWDLFL
ncbi:MAG: GNAT family N-acetyltransferase [Bacillota bacterium]